MAPSVSNSGVIISVRGSVVDIGFDEHLPPIYSVLRAGAEQQIVIEVLAQLDVRRVRGTALTPEFSRGRSGSSLVRMSCCLADAGTAPALEGVRAGAETGSVRAKRARGGPLVAVWERGWPRS